jgi:hypothetical protein
MEAMILIEKSDLYMNLSESDLFFCSSHGPTCDGWWLSASFDSVKLRGISDGLCDSWIKPNSEQPYFTYFYISNKITIPSCESCSDRADRTTKATKFVTLLLNSDVKNYISTVGPVAAAFDVYTDFFYYSSGVYKQVAGVYEGSHAIAIVGYSDIDKCWICKNSWDTTWGDNGFFKIGYGECLIDVYWKNGMSGIILPNEPVPPPPLTESLEVRPSLFRVTQAAGKSKAIITSNTDWVATSNMAWCSVHPTSGTGNATLTIAYNANKGNARTANIILKSVNNPSIHFSGGDVTGNILMQVVQQKYIKPKFLIF